MTYPEYAIPSLCSYDAIGPLATAAKWICRQFLVVATACFSPFVVQMWVSPPKQILLRPLTM